jgi:ubiquinone/menaquinone biosynthesis C-methylase UbiE
MESIGRVVDLGCDTEALNMLWFANATTNNDIQESLNIKCVGQSNIEKLLVKHNSISFQKGSPESLDKTKKKFDVLYCHDTLHFIMNPYQALCNWWHIANKDAMLVIAVQQTTNVEFNTLEFNAQMNHKYHYTIPMLIYMLAVNGWDCNGGFFKKAIGDPWIFAVVYKSDTKPMDPNTTNLYKLLEETDLPPGS